MEDPVNMAITETRVQPERLLKDLRNLWSDLAKQDENGVLRACALTLIVAVRDEPEAVTHVGETIALLMHEHPSRAIVVRVQDGDGPEFSAQVLAQCWMPFGRRQQICCEQIEITCTHATLQDLPSVIRGVVVPDLPVVLFCPTAGLCQSPEFAALVSLCDKLIVDSGDTPGIKPIESLNKLSRPAFRTADLAWGRLTPWRETIARLFDTPAAARAIGSLEDVHILYAGADEPIGVYYLSAWFMHVLGSGVHLNIARGVGPAYGGIAQVKLSGKYFEAEVELVDTHSVDIRSPEQRQRILFPDLSHYELLRRELAIVGRDPIFEDALGLATLLGGKS
jgi:glucose-6-phosphate dehydrogenase assembly protein OpcA